MNAAETDTRKPDWRERARVELREFAVLAGYLFICFTALAYFKDALLQAHGTSYVPWAFAAIKALVSAKFLLIGRMLGIGDGLVKHHPLIYSTLFKSIAFLLVLAALTIVEEIVVGHLHGNSLADSLADLAGGTPHRIIATCVLIFLILVPYFAFRALGEVIGDRTLARLYFEPRGSANNPEDEMPAAARPKAQSFAEPLNSDLKL